MLAGDLLVGRLLTARRRQPLTEPLRLLLAAPYLLFFLALPVGIAVVLVLIASIGYPATLLLRALLAITPAHLSGHALGLHTAGMLSMQAVEPLSPAQLRAGLVRKHDGLPRDSLDRRHHFVDTGLAHAFFRRSISRRAAVRTTSADRAVRPPSYPSAGRCRRGRKGRTQWSSTSSRLSCPRPGRRMLAATSSAHLAYNAEDGTPRVIPVGYFWTGAEFVVSTAITSPKVSALRARPDVALAIDGGDTPGQARALSVRGRASVEIVDGLVPEYIAASRKSMGAEAAAEFEKNCRAMYDQMAGIAIAPSWVRFYDFGTGPHAAIPQRTCRAQRVLTHCLGFTNLAVGVSRRRRSRARCVGCRPSTDRLSARCGSSRRRVRCRC